MYVFRVGVKTQIDSIFKNGFSRQFLGSHEGTDYGDGVYCNINIEDSLKRLRYTTDGCLFKCKIEGGISRYLVFNEKYARIAHGANYSIKDQVYNLFGEDADKVWRDFSSIMNVNHSAREHMHGRTAELLQVLLSPRNEPKRKLRMAIPDRCDRIRHEYEILFKKHNIQGVIYRGMNDGLCLVAYDFGKCIPVAYSLNAGHTWLEKEFEGSTVDVQKKYALMYKKVFYPIRIDFDGETYEFSRVQKKNGKYNFIEIESGEEISTVDFDSATDMNPETGYFDIEYGGYFFTACVQGFFLDEDELNMHMGHTFDELLSIFENRDHKFEMILENAIKEALDRLTENTVNEGVINEVNYMGYQIPTLEELDDPNMISLYHATPRDKINSIFAFGFDREFAKVMAYGEGVYTTPSVRESSTLLGSYGDTILQTKVIGGFDRFLMFEPNYARRYYGRNCSILDQLKTMLPEYQAIELYRRFGEDVRSYSTVASEYKIRGAIYNWGSVVAVLPYDFSSIIPYAVSYDAGKTFQKKATEDTIDRFISSVDVTYRFGNKYKEINKAVAGLNFENKLTGYARVKKHNGKYNLVDIQTGEEISPIDFDSVTNMIPLSKDAEFSSDKVGTNAGDFDIEYHGHHFNACIYGFFLDKDEYMMNMGHTFDELPEIVE